MTFDDMEHPKTFLPGIKAIQTVITPACRKMRTDEGAAEEAIKRVKEELLLCLEGWPEDAEATFHIILTVDRLGR